MKNKSVYFALAFILGLAALSANTGSFAQWNPLTSAAASNSGEGTTQTFE